MACSAAIPPPPARRPPLPPTVTPTGAPRARVARIAKNARPERVSRNEFSHRAARNGSKLSACGWFFVDFMTLSGNLSSVVGVAPRGFASKAVIIRAISPFKNNSASIGCHGARPAIAPAAGGLLPEPRGVARLAFYPGTPESRASALTTGFQYPVRLENLNAHEGAVRIPARSRCFGDQRRQ